MPILHLGVVDIPYVEKPPAARRAPGRAGRRAKPVARAAAQTTGDVAEILEAKYAVMGVFAEQHQTDIAGALAGDMALALDALLTGSGRAPLFQQAGADIEQMFRTFLDSGEVERVGIPGVPTGAALRGVSHRLKHPYAKGNPRRPSFIDSGTYQASMKAWVDDLPNL